MQPLSSPLESVSHLSLHSLRVELRRRNLPTTGLRPTLERRLCADLHATRTKSPSTGRPTPSIARAPRCVRKRPRGTISVPRVFPPSERPRGVLALLPPHPHDEHVLRRVADTNRKPPRAAEHARFRGVLRGRAVWVMGHRQMIAFWEEAGPCGKANLSRSVPSYDVPDAAPPAALKGRAMRQLLAMEEGAENTARQGERQDVEHLQLTLVEAFYCTFVINCLVIVGRDAELMDPQKTWQMFCERAPAFPTRFVAYCRYRAVGWLPRSGIKYGVDWVLYPAAAKKHAHSPYCVVLQEDGECSGIQKGTERGAGKLYDRSWVRLQNRLRLVKNVAKTLVIARISRSENVDLTKSFETAFRVVQVAEMTVDRWIP